MCFSCVWQGPTVWCQLCGNYLGHRTLHLTLTSPIRLQSNHYHDEDDRYDSDQWEDDADDDGGD